MLKLHSANKDNFCRNSPSSSANSQCGFEKGGSSVHNQSWISGMICEKKYAVKHNFLKRGFRSDPPFGWACVTCQKVFLCALTKYVLLIGSGKNILNVSIK